MNKVPWSNKPLDTESIQNARQVRKVAFFLLLWQHVFFCWFFSNFWLGLDQIIFKENFNLFLTNLCDEVHPFGDAGRDMDQGFQDLVCFFFENGWVHLQNCWRAFLLFIIFIYIFFQQKFDNV